MLQSQYKKRFTLFIMFMCILALVLGSSSAVIAGEKKLDVEICAFDGQDKFNLDPPHNPYFPLSVGSYWELAGEEDDESIELLMTVTPLTEEVGEVETRVVTEEEWIDGTRIEVSLNYFAYLDDGTVCYFGEAVFICDSDTGGVVGDLNSGFECDDGSAPDDSGAWRADDPGNFPGIFMPGDPESGQKYMTEGAPGIAEDEVKIIGQGPDSVEAGDFEDNIRWREYNPIDEEKDYKVFNNGFGILRDGPLELIDSSLL